MTKTYHIITLGCQMNTNDSEYIAGMLETNGYQPTEDKLQANLVIYNTCSVRDKAERRVYGQVTKLDFLRKKNKVDQKLLLAGCMPAYSKDKILEKMPFLDGFIDTNEARQYRPKRAGSPEAWVAIMTGCDNFCSYCIVPYTRGRETSRSVNEILPEIKALDFSKHSSLVLLGQNVNSYQGGSSFPQLLEKILHEFPHIPKVSFLTSHPKDMSDDLITLIAREPRIDRELHLPLQAGNNRILQLMNRKYTYEQYKTLVAKIRTTIPDVKISTDIIVGFPSETESEFEDTLKAVREIKFNKVLTMNYSPRVGTAAEKMAGRIDQKILDQRLQRLMKTVDEAKVKIQENS